MVFKHCAHGLCKNNTRRKSSGTEKICYVPFPKPKTNLSKCKRWITACNRVGFGIDNIKKHTYICSKHFVGSNGPTGQHPDPVFATGSNSCKLDYRSMRKLAVETIDPDRTFNESSKFNQSSNYTIVVLAHENNNENQKSNNFESNSNEYESSANFKNIETENEQILDNISLNDILTSEIESETFSSSGVVNSQPIICLDLKAIHDAVKPPSGWAAMLNTDTLVYMKYEEGIQVMKLCVYETFWTSFTVLDITLELNHEIHQRIYKEVTSVGDVEQIFASIEPYNICNGNNDQKFVNFFQSRPPNAFKKANYIALTKSVHHKECPLLITTQRCKNCQKIRSTLRVCYGFHLREKPAVPKATCNYRYLSKEQLIERIKAKDNQLILYRKKLRRLHMKVLISKP